VIVFAFCAAVLGASVVLVRQLRTLEADRSAGRSTLATSLGATATRVAFSVVIVAAYVVLILAWAVSAIPTTALLPLVTAPLAMRLGDTVSHRAGAELEGAEREAMVLAVAFVALFAFGLTFVFVTSVTGP
jgi:1,4-dihydroxy-2-naphthoate octaprenyltransferase